MFLDVFIYYVMAAFFLIQVVTHSPLKALLSHNHTALIAQIWKQKYVLLAILTKLSQLKHATTNKLSIAFPDKSALCQFILASKLYFEKYLSTKKKNILLQWET